MNTNEYWHQFARFHNFTEMAEKRERNSDDLEIAKFYRSIAADALAKMNQMLAASPA